MPTIMKVKGFTLIELMIAVAVVGILALVAVPSYQGSVRKSNRSDAIMTLQDLAMREERFFADNKTYTATLSDIDATAASPKGHYTIAIAAMSGKTIATSFVLTATAASSDDQYNDTQCRTWTLNSTGQKTAADSSSNSTTDLCWAE